MVSLPVDLDQLHQFEAALDPARPEQSRIPTKVLGYGEVSTVLQIGDGELAYKRMPMFKDEEEITRYTAVFDGYIQLLQYQVGIEIVPSKALRVVNKVQNLPTVYLAQPKLSGYAIGSQVLRVLTPADANG